MIKLLIYSSLAWSTMGQNTGGFFFGPSEVGEHAEEGDCTDNRGQSIPEGLLFTPGQDECQVCTCLRKMPVLCRTVLCAPPMNCVSLRVGDACCQWICDDVEPPPGSISDIGLRLVASAITAILSLSLLFFLIYRLRQRRLRGRQNHLQAESFNSVLGQTEDCWVGDTQLSSHGVDWRKPLEGTFNRPFPPSYDEAVSSTNTGETHLEDPGNPAPPYQGPVLPYQVATLGRRVFPVGIDSTSTLPSVLRRIRRNTPDREQRVNEPEPEWVRPEVRINLHPSSTRHSNPLFRHSLQICSGYSEDSFPSGISRYPEPETDESLVPGDSMEQDQTQSLESMEQNQRPVQDRSFEQNRGRERNREVEQNRSKDLNRSTDLNRSVNLNMSAEQAMNTDEGAENDITAEQDVSRVEHENMTKEIISGSSPVREITHPGASPIRGLINPRVGPVRMTSNPGVSPVRGVINPVIQSSDELPYLTQTTV